MEHLSDEYYMELALEQARVAASHAEVPIGAVVVAPDGRVIGVGYNQTEHEQCQTAHAEVRAIQKACAHQKTWRLEDCTLYVTVEPCLMCMGLIGLSRVGKLVYGIESQKFGYSLHTCAQKDTHLFSHLKQVVSGVCAEQAHALLREFFGKKR